jgi:hypothetical protein
VVLTGSVRTSDVNKGAGRTRRRVLSAAGVAALGVAGVSATGGCGLLGDDDDPPPPPDPAQPVLDGALTLAAAYDRTIVAQPGLAKRLTPIVEAHRAHAAELTRVIGARVPSSAAAPAASATATAPAGDAKTALDALRAAERKAQKVAATLCRTAAANRATLLGTIAAARATHAEALI